MPMNETIFVVLCLANTPYPTGWEIFPWEAYKDRDSAGKRAIELRTKYPRSRFNVVPTTLMLDREV